jgi:hypothetical protein
MSTPYHDLFALRQLPHCANVAAMVRCTHDCDVLQCVAGALARDNNTCPQQQVNVYDVGWKSE